MALFPGPRDGVAIRNRHWQFCRNMELRTPPPPSTSPPPCPHSADPELLGLDPRPQNRTASPAFIFSLFPQADVLIKSNSPPPLHPCQLNSHANCPPPPPDTCILGSYMRLATRTRSSSVLLSASSEKVKRVCQRRDVAHKKKALRNKWVVGFLRMPPPRKL